MDIYQFVKRIEGDSDMQKEIRACLNKKEFIKFLKKYNLEYLLTDFQEKSRYLFAEYWPWSSLNKIERNNFFK